MASLWMLWEGVHFQAPSGCWENPVPCGCKTKVLDHLLTVSSQLLDATHFLPVASFSIFKARKGRVRSFLVSSSLSTPWVLSLCFFLRLISASSAAFQGQHWIIFPYYSFQLFGQKRNIFVVLLVDYIISILVSRKFFFNFHWGYKIFILFLYDKIHCFK